MKKHIYFLILFIIPFVTKASDTTLTNNNLSWRSTINLESNSLTMDFASKMLFGGFIDDFQKKEWISKLNNYNILFSEFRNSINYKKNVGKNSFSLILSDRSLARLSFTDDLMKVALFGNYHYQGETLSFNKTNLIYSCVLFLFISFLFLFFPLDK